MRATRAGRWLAFVAVLAVAAASVAHATTAQSSWSAPQRFPAKVSSGGVSCPTVSLCVGSGRNSYRSSGPSFLISSAPARGTSWHLEGSDRDLWGAAECPSAHLCVMIDELYYPSLWASRNPAKGIGSFRKVSAHAFDPGSPGSVGDVSCPTENFCADLVHGQNEEGSPVYVSDAPARPGSWKYRGGPAPGGSENLYDNAIVCVSAQLCLAYNTFADGRAVSVIENPAERQSRWVKMDVAPDNGDPSVIGGSCKSNGSCVFEEMTGAACVPSGACLLTTSYGRIIASTDPAAGASAWTRTRVYGTTLEPEDYWGLSDPVCFSTSLCYALGAQGDLLVSTDPFGADAASWVSTPIPGVPSGYNAGLDELSCPSEGVCFVMSANSRSRFYPSKITVGRIIAQ